MASDPADHGARAIPRAPGAARSTWRQLTCIALAVTSLLPLVASAAGAQPSAAAQHGAAAAERVWLSLRWQGDSKPCIDTVQLAGAVAERLGEPVATSVEAAQNAHLRIEIDLYGSQDGGYRAALTSRSALDHGVGSRELAVQGDCARLASSLALVVSLLVGEAPHDAPHDAPPDEGGVAAGTDGAAESAPQEPLPPKDAAPAPQPDPVEEKARPKPARGVATGPDRDAAQPRPWGVPALSLGAAAELTMGILEAALLSAGAVLAVELERRDGRRLSLLDVGVHALVPAEVDDDGAAGTVRGGFARVQGCAGQFRDSFSVEPCVGLRLAVLDLQARLPDGPRGQDTAVRGWMDLGLSMRLRIHGPTQLVLRAGLGVPFDRSPLVVGFRRGGPNVDVSPVEQEGEFFNSTAEPADAADPSGTSGARDRVVLGQSSVIAALTLGVLVEL